MAKHETLTIPADRLMVVNGEGDLVQEGAVVLYAGLGQPDPRTEALTGKKAVRF